MRTNAKLEVRLDDLSFNISLLKTKCRHSTIIFMVKANAYGHGAVEVVKHTFDNCNINHFGCATMEEALELRLLLAPRKFELYVFSENQLSELDDWKDKYLDKNITPVILDLKTLERILNDKEFAQIPIVIKINTGMNRFGISVEEVADVAKLLIGSGRNQIDHLMTHFPCSPDIKKIEETKAQFKVFQNVKSNFKKLGIDIIDSSCSNSGAIEHGIGLDESFIRPGLMLYGPNISPGNPMGWKGKNISSLKVKAIGLRDVLKGDLIGYGAVEATNDGVLAILPLGYADGISANYTQVEFKCGDYIGKMASYVNMDVCLVLFPKEARESLGNQWIDIWGQSVNELLRIARQAKVLPYQLYCQISSRVPRVYKIGYN